MKASFPHPVAEEHVLVFLDHSHMLKRVRNTLLDRDVLLDKNGEQVRWDLLEKLNDVHSREGPHLSNCN